MRTTLISILLLLAVLSGKAQVSYAYDSAGNRTSRVISMAAKASQAPSEAKMTTALPDRVADREITIYPNPTKGIITVKITGYTDEMKAGFRLMDLSGRTIVNRDANAGIQTFDLSGQASGIYLLQIQINGESVIWKIIKE